MAWASNIKEYALQQAVSGNEWNGWKLVEGRSNRKYTNEAAVIQAVNEAGFNELLNGFIEKPQGKPTLVPESDKRPAMNNAKNDFMEGNDNE